MIKPSVENYRRSVILYMIVLALAALGAGLSDTVLSNYFKDAYQVSAFQRGLIEIPREIPGFIGVFIGMFELKIAGKFSVYITYQPCQHFIRA